MAVVPFVTVRLLFLALSACSSLHLLLLTVVFPFLAMGILRLVLLWALACKRRQCAFQSWKKELRTVSGVQKDSPSGGNYLLVQHRATALRMP